MMAKRAALYEVPTKYLVCFVYAFIMYKINILNQQHFFVRSTYTDTRERLLFPFR